VFCGLAEIRVSEAVCAALRVTPLSAAAASVTRAMRAKYCTYASSDHENVNLIVRISTQLGNTKSVVRINSRRAEAGFRAIAAAMVVFGFEPLGDLACHSE
jgi:hypothetical protein